MRVAHILRKYCPAEWGGTETALHQLTAGLAEYQVKSIVFCPAEPAPARGAAASAPTPPSPDPLTAAGCVVERYHACVPIWGLAPAARRQILSVGGNLLSFDLARKLEQEPRLDLIHAHALGRLGGIATTLARRRNLPVVVTLHGGVLDLADDLKHLLAAPTREGFDWGRPFGWWWRARHVLTDADAIVTCNPREAMLLVSRFPGKRIVVHPHGVPAAEYVKDCRAAALAAFPRLEGRHTLLCVGRIDSVKNQTWLVQQLPQLSQRYPQVLLVLAGACTDEAYGVALDAQIRALGLQDRVLRTGGLPPADPRLIGLYQSARTVVLPSLSETFGLVILEAWAAGTPVLASRTTGASSLIRHGENGWLFDLGSPLSFHSALNRTAQEPDLTSRQIAAGRRLVETEYDTRRLAGRMHTLYEQLIAAR